MEALNRMMGKCGGLSMEAISRKNELNHNLNSNKQISNYRYLFSAALIYSDSLLKYLNKRKEKGKKIINGTDRCKP